MQWAPDRCGLEADLTVSPRRSEERNSSNETPRGRPGRMGRKGRLGAVAQWKSGQRVYLLSRRGFDSRLLRRRKARKDFMRTIHLFAKNGHYGKDSKGASMYFGTWDGESACGKVQWTNEDTRGGKAEETVANQRAINMCRECVEKRDPEIHRYAALVA